MANLKINNRNNLRTRINYGEYWDFYINKDSFGRYISNNGMYDGCLVSYIDASLEECIGDDNWIYGTDGYSWNCAVSSGYTLNNISYTGLDNGLFTYRKDRIGNRDFVNIFTKSSYNIEEGDTRLKLHAVSGNTLQYEYPVSIEGGSLKLNGGFFQGFYKTEKDKYNILDDNIGNDGEWNLEFVLRKCDLEKESDKTLNDKYPDNKGIFFYIGTRAENKWIYLYDEDDKEGREECNILSYDDYIEDGHIDKKTYIINNFFDLDTEFVETPPLDIDDYLNFNYYDDKYYTPSESELLNDERYSCEGFNLLDDYVDYDTKPILIDENLPHITMDSWCCDYKEEAKKKKTVQVSFMTMCGCVRTAYKKVDDGDVKDDSKLAGCDLFGEDGYIDDFDGLDYDTDYVESEIDISDFEYDTDNGFALKSSNDYYFYTDNKFLLFDRTKTGYNVSDWVEGKQMMYFGKKNKFKGNLFLLMNRTSTGYTINDIDKLRDEENSSYDDLYNDIYNNAFALRIRDDGSIGYRYLVKDCNSNTIGKYTVEEGYSFPNVISDCEWTVINVNIKSAYNGLKIRFYVNGKLVYITKTLPRFNFHELSDLYEKQEGVPFNISIGGGTQGLAETILANYMLNPTRVYPLEENFAGSFIGYIKSFKFYQCGMKYKDIVGNYKYEMSN